MEIQYRAWDRVGKEMLTNVQNHINDPDWAFGRMIKNPERFAVMQYSDLKDKNGVKIYQSDIVECDYGRGEVVWMLGAWMVRWIDDKEADMEFLGLNKKGRRAREDGEQFIVIGNIHQNPKLLTQ